MSLEELGAFILLLMEAWLDGARIPVDEAQEILGVSGESWERIKANVLDRMFAVEDGFYVNKKLMEVYRETIARMEKFSDCGKRGNEVRWKKNTESAPVVPALPRASAEPRKVFVIPTASEVHEYCPSIDAESFISFYTSKGWKVGNQPMVDWKAATVTWRKRHPEIPGKRIEAGDEYDEQLFGRKGK